VRVGPAAALDVAVIEAERPVWTAGAAPGPFDAVVQVRAHGGLAPAVDRQHQEYCRGRQRTQDRLRLTRLGHLAFPLRWPGPTLMASFPQRLRLAALSACQRAAA